MNNLLPETLKNAQERGIEYFMGENCEWKFEIEKTPRLIEEIVECPVCVFANNGYGDYLFLMNKGGSERYSEEVYEYFHEGPEIIRVSECLEVILGLKDRPPSNDKYPKAVINQANSFRWVTKSRLRCGRNSGEGGRKVLLSTSRAYRRRTLHMSMAG